MSETSFESFEYLDLVLTLCSRPIRINIIYRPPSKAALTFINEFSSQLDSGILSRTSLLVTVDFHVDHVDFQSDAAAPNFSLLVESLGLDRHVTVPTHRHGHSWISY